MQRDIELVSAVEAVAVAKVGFGTAGGVTVVNPGGGVGAGVASKHDRVRGGPGETDVHAETLTVEHMVEGEFHIAHIEVYERHLVAHLVDPGPVDVRSLIVIGGIGAVVGVYEPAAIVAAVAIRIGAPHNEAVDAHLGYRAAGGGWVDGGVEGDVHGSDLVLEPVFSGTWQGVGNWLIVSQEHLRRDHNLETDRVGAVSQIVVALEGLVHQPGGVGGETDRMGTGEALADEPVRPGLSVGSGDCLAGVEGGQHAGDDNRPVDLPGEAEGWAGSIAFVDDVSGEGDYLAWVRPAALILGAWADVRSAGHTRCLAPVICDAVGEEHGLALDEGHVQVGQRSLGCLRFFIFPSSKSGINLF